MNNEQFTILQSQIDSLTQKLSTLSDSFSSSVRKLTQGLDDANSQFGADNFSNMKVENKKLILSQQVSVGDHDNVAVMSNADPVYSFWVGKADPATAPFRITKSGAVTATSITLTGYTTPGNVTTIIGNTVTTGYVNALSITAGSVAAENITGTYITGKIVRTAATGLRVQLNGSTGSLILNNSDIVYAELEPLYDGSSGSNGFNLLTPEALGISCGSGGSADFLSLSGYNADINLESGNIYYTATSHLFTGAISADNLSGTNTGDEDATSIKAALGITTLSGSNTGDSAGHTGLLALSGGTMTGNITMPGSGYYINMATGYLDNVTAMYLVDRSTTPGGTTPVIWSYASGGTYELRVRINNTVYSVDLTAV